MQMERPAIAAITFLTVGISLKLALFPLHSWLPNAYAYAPSVTTSFLAGTATKVAIYLLMRIFFSTFGCWAHFHFFQQWAQPICMIPGLISSFNYLKAGIF